MKNNKIFNKHNIFFALKVFSVATIAIVVASLLKLDFPISAGIVAILSVAFTKRETLKTAINRLIAFIFALAISFACFNLLGYNTFAFIIYLFLFIAMCQAFKWNNAMAMNSVLISHFLSFGRMGGKEILNECLLFIIGVGLGVLINLTLRKNIDSIEKQKSETDELIKMVLMRMGERIINPDLADYDGTCFIKLRESIRKTTVLAETNYNNQWKTNDVEDLEYISMRERQADMLYVMYKRVSEISTVYATSGALSEFFCRVSREYSTENTVESLLRDYKELDKYMKEMPLPANRLEFEDRARLYSIMRNMEEFLMIKKEYADVFINK